MKRGIKLRSFSLGKGIMVFLILLLLVAVTIPHFIRVRRTTSMNSCLFNMMWIETAKAKWAEENHKTAMDIPTENDLLPYLIKVAPLWDGRRIHHDMPASFPRCFLTPESSYIIGNVSTRIRCPSGVTTWNEAEYRYHYQLD